MLTILSAILSLLSFRLRSRASLELEVIALRHQVTVLRRQRPGRLRLLCADRILWVWLYGIWPRALNVMVLVKPATVIGYVERIIGSIRRECLNHVIIFNERHLRGILSSYIQYYHETRTHLSLDKDCPETRPISPPAAGKIIAFPQVGGLYHRYERRAA